MMMMTTTMMTTCLSLKNNWLPITSTHLLINQLAWRLNCPKYQPRRKNLAKGLLLHRRLYTLLTISEISDDDDDDDDDDEDGEIEVVAAPEARKKGGGKPAANAKAVKAPPAAKKKGVGNKQQPQTLGQKLLTNMLKPAENFGISPKKKVRKMRASPFNKKSGSVLGRVGKVNGVTENEENLGLLLLLPVLKKLLKLHQQEQDLKG